jgi:hypothetical protein
MSSIEVNADDLQAVIMELQAENSNLRIMKSALSRKVKEQALDAQLDEAEKVIPFEKES